MGFDPPHPSPVAGQVGAHPSDADQPNETAKGVSVRQPPGKVGSVAGRPPGWPSCNPTTLQHIVPGTPCRCQSE